MSHFRWCELHGSHDVITPPLFFAFDCLYQHGRDLRPEPLGLADLVLQTDGAAAWAEVERCGLEGLVAKDESAPYRGGPSRIWLKVKVRHEGVRGRLVGQRVAGELVYRGTVEFGVSGAILRELAASPLVRATSPFIDLVRRRGLLPRAHPREDVRGMC